MVKWAGLQAANANFAPGETGGHRPFLLAPYLAFIRAGIEKTPHLTLSRLRDLLAARGVHVGRDAVQRFLKAEGPS